MWEKRGDIYKEEVVYKKGWVCIKRKDVLRERNICIKVGEVYV